MQTIDCTPTWEGICTWLLAVVRDAKPKGRAIAKKELKRMAEIAQHYHQKIKGNMDNTAYKMYMEMHITIYRSNEQPDKVINARNEIVNIAKIADEYIAYKKSQKNEHV